MKTFSSVLLRSRTKPFKPKEVPLRENFYEKPASVDEISVRLAKLENAFSALENQDFYDCRADVDMIKTHVEMLTNTKDTMQDELHKLKCEIKELQMDLNEEVKDQDMLKIIQTEHEQKLSQLTLLKKTPELMQTPPQDMDNYEEDLKTIQNKLEEFDNLLQAVTANMEIFQKTIAGTDNGIIELNKKMTMQKQQLEQIINDNIEALQHQVAKMQENLKRIIPDEINKLQEEIAVLQTRVDHLEETISGVKLPQVKKKDPLPYVEKLAPADLFEIDWVKYH